jgi:hypothetical protein
MLFSNKKGQGRFVRILTLCWERKATEKDKEQDGRHTQQAVIV